MVLSLGICGETRGLSVEPSPCSAGCAGSGRTLRAVEPSRSASIALDPTSAIAAMRLEGHHVRGSCRLGGPNARGNLRHSAVAHPPSTRRTPHDRHDHRPRPRSIPPATARARSPPRTCGRCRASARPCPSPDGTPLRRAGDHATTSRRTRAASRIWLVPADGGEPRALTAPDALERRAARSRPTASGSRSRARTRRASRSSTCMPLDGGEARALTDLPLGVFDPRWLPDGSGLVFARACCIKGHLTPEATTAELERREKDPVKAHVTEERFYRYWDTWLTTGEVPHLFLLDLATGAAARPDARVDGLVRLDGARRASTTSRPTAARSRSPASSFDAGALADRARAIFTVPVAGGALTLPHARPSGRRPAAALHAGRQARSSTACTHDPYFYADRVRADALRPREPERTQPWLDDWDAVAGALGVRAPTARSCSRPRRTARVALFALERRAASRSAIVARRHRRRARAAARRPPVLHATRRCRAPPRSTSRARDGGDAAAAHALHRRSDRVAVRARRGARDARSRAPTARRCRCSSCCRPDYRRRARSTRWCR